ncbi:hypothetical protein COP2_025398 [Malus domestica]
MAAVLNLMELTSTIRCRQKRRLAALQFCPDAVINFAIVLPAASSSSSVQRCHRRCWLGYGDGAEEEGAAMVGFKWVCWDWVSSWVAGFVVEKDEASGKMR